MNDFKLQFYFNLYKDKAFVTRNLFRANFKRHHGDFEQLEELIKIIEQYQIKKYGCTLYENTNSELKQQTNYYLKGKENKECNGRKWRYYG